MSGSPDSRRFRPPPTTAALFLSTLLFLLFLSAPAPARGEYFLIRSFRADIEIRADSSLLVTETIETVFDRPRHGLYREIPFRYTDEVGKKSVMPLRVVSVTDASGKAWKYKVERRGGSLRIRIGDPDGYVDGRQVYVITYTVENAVRFFPDHDELYWNVTGNDWPVGIGSASATVTVAGGGRSLNPRTRCFTGPRGSREEACRISRLDMGATFQSKREFRAGEGLTIVLGWDKGAVRPVAAWKRIPFTLNLSENWVLLAPIFSLGFMLTLWSRKGKDPDPGDPLVVAYAPPTENERPLLPAEVGTLIDERLDPRDITASVVHLGVKRYVTIEEKRTPGLLFDKTDYLLRREKEPDAALSPFERLLMERLFQKGGPEVRVSELKLEFFRNLEDLKDAAFEGLERMRYFAANPRGVKSAYTWAGGGIVIGAGVLGALGEKLTGDVSLRTVIAVVLSGLIVILFAPLMPVKTLKGAKALGRIKGFEEFLLRAEKDRLERMGDANLFEKYLPYAIALGVSERWAKAFEGIYQETPRWYLSQDGAGAFRPSSFHHSLDSALSTLSGAMKAAPRSSGSGFSGGGSSGGGGGGGGGRSW
jgi:hypothetical protein